MPVELRGWGGGNVGPQCTTTMNSLVAGGDSTCSTRVEELSHALCEAELEDEIATIYGVEMDRDEWDATLLDSHPLWTSPLRVCLSGK